MAVESVQCRVQATAVLYVGVPSESYTAVARTAVARSTDTLKIDARVLRSRWRMWISSPRGRVAYRRSIIVW